MSYIHKFITEDDVNYYKSMSNAQIKDMLFIGKDRESLISDYMSGKMKEDVMKFDFRKLYGLPEGDLYLLLEEFREEGFTKYCRKNDWCSSWTKVLNNDGTINEYKTRIASFRYINKWNQETEPSEFKILIDKNNKVLWIGYNYGRYFISAGKNIYRFTYVHKDISLIPNICSTDEYFYEDEPEKNDQLIIKYINNIEMYNYSTFDNAKNILLEKKIGVHLSIDEYFEKGFFYKGPKWNRYFEYMHYNNDTTILISIQPMGNFFYIEIENITYPFYGHMLLDLDKMQIVHAGKFTKHYVEGPSEPEIFGYFKIYFKHETRVYTKDEIDTMLTAFNGNAVNRMNLLKKRFASFFKKISDYKLIIVNKKYVYNISLGSFKKEFNEGYFDIEE